MAHIQTVLGPVDIDDLGLILPHEHLFLDQRIQEPLDQRGRDIDDVLRLMVPYLDQIQEIGVTCLVECTPTGMQDPVVIEANLSLEAKDYTVVAVGLLANIEPLVLMDNNTAPAAGKAHVRFVHASPDAPAVDIAVKSGPVLFSNVAFKGIGDYLPVDAGTYDLEVRLAGTNTVALNVPGLALQADTVYTII